MKACQNVIVTLTIGDEQLDVELPAFLPVAEVNARVLEMLRTLYPQVYGSCTAIRLYDQAAKEFLFHYKIYCAEVNVEKAGVFNQISVFAHFIR